MANGHGGRRQGTPGKGYGNRTDLAQNRTPAQPGKVDPTAAGGITARPPAAPRQPPAPQVTPDMTPSPRDPTANPAEPLTSGLPLGPGPGPEALAGPPPAPNPTVMLLRSMLARTNDPDVRRVLARANDQWVQP